MASFDFDLFVIGGGSGGVRAGRIAADHGARVAVAEEDRFGGTCVIRGCVPKKLFVYASRFPDDFEDAAGYGWSLGRPRFDWGTLVANKDREIARIESVYRDVLEFRGVTTLKTRAVLDGPGAVKLADGRRLTARTILIATGGTPYVDPGFAGREHAITSNEIFHLERLPKRAVVVGGGYIAVEFAGILNGLGVATTMVYRGEKILRGFDDDLRDALMEAYRARGVTLVMGDAIAGIERRRGGLSLRLRSGSEIKTDLVLSATGRRPNTPGLGLEGAGVKTGAAGEIVVDAFSQSSAPEIYAVGDVTNRVNLTPVAIREAHAFADTVFGGKPTRVDHTLVPSAVFSTPEIGTVGLSEAAAQERGEIDIFKSRFRPLRNILAERDERMLMKLVVDRKSGRVLGCHILGVYAAEIVQAAAIAIRMGATKADFDATMALHPTVAEELVTMRDKWVPPA